MKNYLLTLRFDGSAFHGSQRQANAPSVQQAVEEALSVLLREGVKIRPCSRTDAGVHANMYCCSFFAESAFESSRLLNGLNALLPPQAAVYDIKEVEAEFDARKDAVEKEYIYRIWNERQRNPFEQGRALHFARQLDEKAMNDEIQAVVGTHDFAAFCSAGSSVNSTVRTVFAASVERQGSIVEVKIRGSGFLYNMVRIIVGTLLDISDGKIKSGSIGEIIERRNRSNAGATAPPHGLYLNKVLYR